MRIGIIGNGVVGNATGKAFESHGHEVRYHDANLAKTKHTVSQALECDVVFLCLPTPQKSDSLECDTSVIDDFLDAISREGTFRNVNLVLRSTVPVGYTRRALHTYNLPNLVHSPEFLTARTAVEDAANPRILVVGTPAGPSLGWSRLADLYARRWPSLRLTGITSDESEFVKLMQNSFSAIKVAAFNEFRAFADLSNLDWERCLGTMLAQGWVNPMHTQVPGPDGKRGFGGACLPKDLANFIACYRKLLSANMPVGPTVSYAALHRNFFDRKE